VLYPQAPCTAALLAEHDRTILTALQPIFGDIDRPSIDIGERWHHVVCHRVPLPHDSRGDTTAVDVGQELAAWNNVDRGGKDYLASFVMCRREEIDAKSVVSVRLTLKREETVRRLCEEGVFLFGSHCRVSVYVPRKAKNPSGLPSS
jgi:hypothetical protein